MVHVLLYGYFVAHTKLLLCLNESLSMVETNTVEFGNKDIGCNHIYISNREVIGVKQHLITKRSTLVSK